jgi:arabinogalactan endo-1,4-beta-galactosidase
MTSRCWLLLLIFFEMFAAIAVAEEVHTPLFGIDSNYALDMETRGKSWKSESDPVDPFKLFAQQGCQSARIRLWVGDEGANRLKYATETARRAKQVGLKPYLVIFLSDDWADLVKQPVPAVWRNLSPEKKLAAIEDYTESVVKSLSANGIDFDLFEIGNEIDFGICGEFEEEWPKRVSLEFMRTRIWTKMVPILKAAQAGVLKAQPKARFILHLAQWNNVEYCIAFWQAMQAAEVKLDYPGLSYFPTSVKEPNLRPFQYIRTQASRIVESLRKPVMICETGYPAVANFTGQFAEWNQPTDGYPLSDDGQARWIADLTTMIRNDKNFAGVFYWSPEWYDGELWDAFALFNREGMARPGAQYFRVVKDQNR